VLAAPDDQLASEKIPWVLNRFQMIRLAANGEREGVKRIAEALKKAA
jgi:hypothetical protein